MTAQQLILDLGRVPEQRFETYFAGPNAEALANARAFADGALNARSVVVHGPPGCGKSHVVNAMAHTINARGLRVYRATLEDWLDRNEQELPPEADVVVADGDQASLPAALEAALFTWYNARATHGGKMIVALRPPLSASEVRDDLRTRLAAGLVLRLSALDDNGLRAAVSAHAQARGIALNENVLQYLVTRFSRDMGTLTALLDGLDSLSLAEKRAITLPLLRTLVGS
jgi:DnaA-homolog protein